MVYNIKLTHTVVVRVKADSEEQAAEWMYSHTPQEAKELAEGYVKEAFDEEILDELPDRQIANIDISKKDDLSLPALKGSSVRVHLNNGKALCGYLVFIDNKWFVRGFSGDIFFREEDMVSVEKFNF